MGIDVNDACSRADDPIGSWKETQARSGHVRHSDNARADARVCVTSQANVVRCGAVWCGVVQCAAYFALMCSLSAESCSATTRYTRQGRTPYLQKQRRVAETRERLQSFGRFHHLPNTRSQEGDTTPICVHGGNMQAPTLTHRRSMGWSLGSALQTPPPAFRIRTHSRAGKRRRAFQTPSTYNWNASATITHLQALMRFFKSGCRYRCVDEVPCSRQIDTKLGVDDTTHFGQEVQKLLCHRRGRIISSNQYHSA